MTDPEKKKAFDSSLPFDDSIPKETEVTEENFYEVFDPVFKRNSIWSKKKPIPEIGLATTSLKKVKAFYDFWDNF